MKLSSSQKLIISILIVVVVVVAAVLLLIVPQINRLSALGAEIDQANADYEAASLLLERRQEAKSNAAVTETELLRLSNEVPEAPELPAFIIDLQNTANESGLDFARIVPGEPAIEDEEVWTTIPIEITVQGSWADYVEYLRKMRGIVRQVRIASFDVIPYSPDIDVEELCYEPPNYIEAVMSIEVYTLSPEASTSASGAAPPPAE